MKTQLEKHKKRVKSFFDSYLTEKSKDIATINIWGRDVIERFRDFLITGKMLRGCMVLHTYRSYKKRIDKNAVLLAAAIELFHSSILIHDDVIDKDILRRGKLSILGQYKKYADSKGFNDTYHFGESFAICAANIGYFLCFDLIKQLKVPERVKSRILDFFILEIIVVCLSEMDDVHLSKRDESVTEKEVLKLYFNKTARYTFTMPFLLGYYLVGNKKTDIDFINKISGFLGTAFQMRDDKFSIFGNEKITGKPVGGDIKENKKTLYYTRLFSSANEKEITKLKKIFGKDIINNEDLDLVQKTIKKYSIDFQIEEEIKKLHDKVIKMLKKSPLPDELNQLMIFLSSYNMQRNK